MNYLLDTCILAELLKPDPDARIMEWIEKIPSNRLCISVISIGELRRDITLLPDSRHKDAQIAWMATLVEQYADRILPISVAIADNWGLVQIHTAKTGQALNHRDSLIVATAYTHHLIMVTASETDFEAGIIPVLNPWTLKHETAHEE
jgi:toxin FitB